MKRYFVCFLTIGLLLAICPPCYGQCSKMAIVGTWKLICIERVDWKDNVLGPYEWLGKKQIGLRIYDTSGYYAVQDMRDPPAASAGSLEEMADAFRAYHAHFGTYEIKEMEGKQGKEGVVLHHLQGSLMPGKVGMYYHWTFKISGNRLMITVRQDAMRLTYERVEKKK